jgi:large subunit ribosomal protein L3
LPFLKIAGLDGFEDPNLGSFFCFMTGFILGEKGTSSQKFDENGQRWPVTKIFTSPCYLIGVKTKEKDGYFACLLGFKQVKNIKKPVLGKLAKAGMKTPLRFLKEIRLDDFENDISLIKEEKGDKVLGLEIKSLNLKLKIGEQINPKLMFKAGEKVMVAGVSKGKGFAGVVKRHHFAGGPRTHGQSDRERAPGAIGQTTTPGRVYKGKRMAGRMGGERVTVKNLKVMDVADDYLLVSGLVPGAKGGFLEVVS